VIEVRASEEEPGALKVLDSLSKKQRRRVGPMESHAAGRWSSKEVLARVRAEFLAEHPDQQT
jgi:hypothetical protein